MHREGTLGRRDLAPVTADRLVICYALAAAAAALAILQSYGLVLQLRAEWFLLTGLALIAEFLPVRLSRKSLRITFALPYIAGMAIAVGPAGAVLLELMVTVAVTIALASSGKNQDSPSWMSANASISVLSAAAGGISLSLVPAAPALQALAFTAAYTVANFSLVSYLDYIAGGRKLSESMIASLRMGLQAFALYGLIAMGVAVLLSLQMGGLVALTLVPVLVLRGLVVMQERAYAHYYDTITALTLMLQRTHPYTHGHLERVSRVAEEVALRLGLTPARARLVREAAVLHDIGKIAIDEEILDAPRKLTAPEMDHVRRHSAFGAEILAQSPKFKEVSGWILHHHERPDGQGYPYGLHDKEIPIESKIIAVSDAYDAMTGGDTDADKRAYREPLSHAQALRELEACSGTQFDPQVVRAFQEVMAGGAA
ncbi:MAG: HD-GYP domain-containing protein [Fimbriimonadaceae bacterium]